MLQFGHSLEEQRNYSINSQICSVRDSFRTSLFTSNSFVVKPSYYLPIRPFGYGDIHVSEFRAALQRLKM